MNRREHLLTVLGEECAEVAKACSKALRFGTGDKEPGQEFTNLERLRQEFFDLLGAYSMIEDEFPDMVVADELVLDAIDSKKERVERFLLKSRELGTLKEG